MVVPRISVPLTNHKRKVGGNVSDLFLTSVLFMHLRPGRRVVGLKGEVGSAERLIVRARRRRSSSFGSVMGGSKSSKYRKMKMMEEGITEGGKLRATNLVGVGGMEGIACIACGPN
jgi:hypothetical protein